MWAGKWSANTIKHWLESSIMAVKPVFIFSLPRSGSTMLQRMLACHNEIYTQSELWFLLPHIEAVRNQSTEALYSTNTLRKATTNLLQQMPDGVDCYYKAIRALSYEIYNNLTSDHHRYILDKTPRYYFIINEIEKVFPEAKFIFLFRNPLSVMASVVESFNKGRLGDFHHKIDLYEGPKLLAEAHANFSLPSHTLSYENLVKNPEKEMMAICNYLEIEYLPEVINDFTDVPLVGLGDKFGSKKHKGVHSGNIDKWRKVFATPYRKKILTKYVDYLDTDTLDILGYPKSCLEKDVESIKTRFELGLVDRYYEFKSNVYSILEMPLLKKNFRHSLKSGTRFYIHH